jgi:outer membrane protein OmpA-like peptidoglycan-associated protein
MKLSEQRAEAVRNHLISLGVPADSITAKGYGPTQPVASNDTPEGRRANQRVELRYVAEIE